MEEMSKKMAYMDHRQQELTDMIQQRDGELKAIAEEFEQLDNYSKLLEQHLEQAQLELKSRSSCPSCGAAIGALEQAEQE